jgi:hypothetical protein
LAGLLVVDALLGLVALIHTSYRRDARRIGEAGLVRAAALGGEALLHLSGGLVGAILLAIEAVFRLLAIAVAADGAGGRLRRASTRTAGLLAAAHQGLQNRRKGLDIQARSARLETLFTVAVFGAVPELVAVGVRCALGDVLAAGAL